MTILLYYFAHLSFGFPLPKCIDILCFYGMFSTSSCMLGPSLPMMLPRPPIFCVKSGPNGASLSNRLPDCRGKCCMNEKVRLSTVGIGRLLLTEYLCAGYYIALLLPTLLCAAAKFSIYEGRFGVMKGPLEVCEFIQPPLSLKPPLSGGGNCRRPVLPS